MSGRYEVSNRYSAYLEARRTYLDASLQDSEDESESDAEIRTILRRPYLKTTTTRFSESGQTPPKLDSPKIEEKPIMVLVPPIQPANREIVEVPVETALVEKPEITVSDASDYENNKPAENGHSAPEVVVVEHPNQTIIATICKKIDENIEKVHNKYQNLKARFDEISWEIPEDVKPLWTFISYLFLVFLTGFTLLSMVRAISYQVHGPEVGWFCRYFSNPFSPLFDALCEQENVHFVHRLPLEMSNLADEIGVAVAGVFGTIAAGFRVFGTLFQAICEGLTYNLSFGFQELGENLGENIAHLLHFFVQIFHLLIHFVCSFIATVAGGVSGAFSSIHDYFQPPEEFVW